MKVLVINCGSSSLKYQIFDMDTQDLLCKGLVERIGIDGSVLTHKVPGKDDYVIAVSYTHLCVSWQMSETEETGMSVIKPEMITKEITCLLYTSRCV